MSGDFRATCVDLEGIFSVQLNLFFTSAHAASLPSLIVF